MVQNPFRFGNPVVDQGNFFGRKSEIQTIINRLLSSAHESTSLVGDSRMGNTSLLKYLAQPEITCHFGLDPDRYLLVYIDFQSQANLSQDLFWKRVLTSIYRSAHNPEIKKLAGEFRKLEKYDLFDLEDFFYELSDLGIIIVLLMDEFEYITQSTQLSVDFFGVLRSLAIHTDLALVTATRHEMSDLCHSDEIKGSPFFNIFATVLLGPFSPEDSDQMLEAYLTKSDLQFTQADKEYISSLGKGHPYFLQMAGYYWIEGKNQGLVSQQLLDFVFTKYCEESLSHLKWLWFNFDQEKKHLLKLIANQNDDQNSDSTNPESILQAKTHQTSIDQLLKRGLITEIDNSYSITLPCMEKFILDENLSENNKNLSQNQTHEIAQVENSGSTDFEVFISH
jgi:hypothetical protein